MEPITSISPSALSRRVSTSSELNERRANIFGYRRRMLKNDNLFLLRIRSFWMRGKNHRIEHTRKKDANGNLVGPIIKTLRVENERNQWVPVTISKFEYKTFWEDPFFQSLVLGDAPPYRVGPLTRLESHIVRNWPADHAIKLKFPPDPLIVLGDKIRGEGSDVPRTLVLYLIALVHYASCSYLPDARKHLMKAMESRGHALIGAAQILDPLNPVSYFIESWVEYALYPDRDHNYLPGLWQKNGRGFLDITRTHPICQRLCVLTLNLLGSMDPRREQCIREISRHYSPYGSGEFLHRMIHAHSTKMSIGEGDIFLSKVPFDDYVSLTPRVVPKDAVLTGAKVAFYARSRCRWVLVASRRKLKYETPSDFDVGDGALSKCIMYEVNEKWGMLVIDQFAGYHYYGVINVPACPSLGRLGPINWLPTPWIGGKIDDEFMEKFGMYQSRAFSYLRIGWKDENGTPYGSLRCYTCRTSVNPMVNQARLPVSHRPGPDILVSDLECEIPEDSDLHNHVGHHGVFNNKEFTFRAPAHHELLATYMMNLKAPGDRLPRFTNPSFKCLTCGGVGVAGFRNGNYFSPPMESHMGHILLFPDCAPIEWWGTPNDKSWYSRKVNLIRSRDMCHILSPRGLVTAHSRIDRGSGSRQVEVLTLKRKSGTPAYETANEEDEDGMRTGEAHRVAVFVKSFCYYGPGPDPGPIGCVATLGSSPAEIIGSIASWLKYRDIIKLSRVCWATRSLIFSLPPSSKAL